MNSQLLRRSFVATSLKNPRVGALPFHLKPQPGLLAFAKNNESGIVVGVYSKRGIPRHLDFDIQIKVRGGEVAQVLYFSQSQVPIQNEDLPDDYLEMLSLAFPDSEMLPKAHPR
jgi:hypothetical protein